MGNPRICFLVVAIVAGIVFGFRELEQTFFPITAPLAESVLAWEIQNLVLAHVLSGRKEPDSPAPTVAVCFEPRHYEGYSEAAEHRPLPHYEALAVFSYFRCLEKWWDFRGRLIDARLKASLKRFIGPPRHRRDYWSPLIEAGSLGSALAHMARFGPLGEEDVSYHVLKHLRFLGDCRDNATVEHDILVRVVAASPLILSPPLPKSVTGVAEQGFGNFLAYEVEKTPTVRERHVAFFLVHPLVRREKNMEVRYPFVRVSFAQTELPEECWGKDYGQWPTVLDLAEEYQRESRRR